MGDRRSARAPPATYVSLGNDASLTSHGGGAGGAGGRPLPRVRRRRCADLARRARSARASLASRLANRRRRGIRRRDTFARRRARDARAFGLPSDARVLELIAALEDAADLARSTAHSRWRGRRARWRGGPRGRGCAGDRGAMSRRPGFALASSSSGAASSSSRMRTRRSTAELFGGAVDHRVRGLPPRPLDRGRGRPERRRERRAMPPPLRRPDRPRRRAPLRRRACGFAHPRPGRVRGALRRRARARVPLERGDRRAGPERLGPAERRGRSGAQREERGRPFEQP